MRFGDKFGGDVRRNKSHLAASGDRRQSERAEAALVNNRLKRNATSEKAKPGLGPFYQGNQDATS